MNLPPEDPAGEQMRPDIEAIANRVLIEALMAGRSEDEAQTLVSQAYRRSLTESAQGLSETLRAETAQTVKERKAERGAFERRLRYRWRPALDLYEVVHQACLELGGNFNNQHRAEAASEGDLRFEAIVRIQARACSVGSEVLTLLRSGHARGAMARWRTLEELAVITSLLAKRSQRLARRFIDHEIIESVADLEAVAEHAKMIGEDPVPPEELLDARRVRARLLKRYGARFKGSYGWASTLFTKQKGAPSFRDLEKRAGLAHLRPFYRRGGHEVHGGSRGAALGVLTRGPNTMLQAGPTNWGLAEPGHGALIALVQITMFLLLDTRPVDPTAPAELVAVEALVRLLSDAGEAFLNAHQRLEADEERLWRNS